MTTEPSRRGIPDPPDALPVPVVDNHTHLDISRDGVEVAVGDLGSVLAAASAVGVDRVVQVGCDLAGARFAVAAEATSAITASSISSVTRPAFPEMSLRSNTIRTARRTLL